jgi:FeS assembly SUF system protein
MPAIIESADPIFTQKVIDVFKTIYDPEIPVDIWELGLIYEIKVSADKDVFVKMTLTSPNCPAAESLPQETEEKVRSLEGVKSMKLEITFEPPWERDMMSEVAQLELGFM